MASTESKKMKMSDFFNAISNPSGGFNSALSIPTLKQTQAPMSIPSGPMSVDPRRSLSSVASGSPIPTPAKGPVSAVQPVTPAPGPSRTPVGPAGSTGTAPTQVPKQWMNADGSYKTAEEIAAGIATGLKGASTGPDIGRLSGAQFGGGKTEEQLATEARLISAARNDIAVGETDPYKAASKSGIAYTPAQLQAIEKAYAGIYDPALAGAMSRLEAVQKANAEADKWKKELEKIAIEHDYDLEKMDKDQSFQYGLAAYKASLDAKNAASGITPYSDERSFRAVQSIDELLGQVDGWTTGFGSLLSAIPTTDAKYFKGQLKTLTSSIAFNELTAMREASKTGGALGNVSNIELGLLENALASLDQAQSPEQIRIQLTKAKDSINRWRTAMGATSVGSSPSGSTSIIPSGTDGASYGFPGYVSDGTQWVEK